jgi:hypothetical protein
MVPTEADDPRPPGPVRFSPPDPYNVLAAADALGGGAAPVMAGFAVALMALAIDIHDKLGLPGVSMMFFALSAVSLSHVVQVNGQARAYAVTPSQALEWYPDADNPERRQAIADELRQYQQTWVRLVRRSRRAFNLGLVSFLIGAAVMLVPDEAKFFGPARIAAMVVLGSAAILELVAMVGDTQLGQSRRWLRWAWHISGWVSALPRGERERRRISRGSS